MTPDAFRRLRYGLIGDGRTQSRARHGAAQIPSSDFEERATESRGSTLPRVDTKTRMGSDELGFEQKISAVAALRDPTRRALYLYTVAQNHQVSRDEAAQAAGVTRAVAAFHLDRLVEAGLLEATYRRPEERRGPGAGRPPKFYREAQRDVRIAFPPRNYELAAVILRRVALPPRSSQDDRKVARTARRVGERLGRKAIDSGPARGGRTATRALQTWLDASGYRPRWNGTRLELGNCPFKGLVEDCPDLICHANLGLMEGVAQTLEVEAVTPQLDCQPGMCCVSFVPSPRGRAA